MLTNASEDYRTLNNFAATLSVAMTSSRRWPKVVAKRASAK